EHDLPPRPTPPPGSPQPPSPASAGSGPAAWERSALESKLSELERRLAQEREKLLLANAKREAEAANAAKVELSLKELQEKLRRDRRDQEQEELRGRLEEKLQEMEQRLAQERETWSVALRGQLQSRQGQDKELESHFALRVQELERRLLDEKAQWQKEAASNEEELGRLRARCEKLNALEGELARAAAEKRWLETRVQELLQERAEVAAKIQTALEREKENLQLRGELQLARQQAAAAQDKIERDLQSLRLSAKEREERLLADQQRLQGELASLGARARAEADVELRRLKSEHEAQLARHKDAVERAAVDLQRLRGAATALERQLSVSRAKLAELQAARSSWEKTQERSKAEFIVLQRKWAEREKEIRSEAAERSAQLLEAERLKLKALAQEEINRRVSRLAEQLQKERDAELKRAEASFRADIERQGIERVRALQSDWDKARRELEDEIERLHRELRKSAGGHEELEDKALELERLCSAQAAQLRNLQERLDLARELRLSSLRAEGGERPDPPAPAST
ncbi:MAG: hypothetical protein KGK30_05015, partial [Elusimicrobia bacterium]|nr:hypothetical protein [Elusimicrobiota bacterium]